MTSANALDAGQLRVQLVAALQADGTLKSECWIKAFTKVPRHAFVPVYFRQDADTGGFDRVANDDLTAHIDWLRGVYSNDVLLTQIDETGVATSSSTAPGLMALMLEALEIDDGVSVLEVGTGTGYNASLLCERLGAELVTSIDIDANLVEVARTRLAALGYTPTLAANDGLRGYQANAPYQRIIAAVAVPSIPDAWIAQTNRGGRLLANLYRELGGGALVLLSVEEDRAEGRFLPDYGGFMPVRSCRVPPALSLMRAARGTDGELTEASITGQVLDDPGFAFFAALLVPAQRLEFEPEGESAEFWLLGADGSWAKQMVNAHGTSIVAQRGPQRLWDMLTKAHRDWLALGSPPRQEFGLTVRPDGQHSLWNSREPTLTWPFRPSE